MPVMAGTVLKGSAQPVVDFICGGAHPLIHCVTPQALPLGMLLTTVGIGAVVGALLVASLPNSARRGPMLTVGNIGFPLMLVLFSLSRSFVMSMVLLLFVGMAFVWQNSLANTMLQLVAPDELRGRIMSVYSMVMQSMQRVGGLQAGFTADRLGANMSIGGGAFICLLYGLFIAIRYPKVRKMA
jgi:predicted MFS family arabinose efflux permease